MPASNNGFVKFDRKMTEWEWYRDVPTKVLFIHCIFRANWKIGCVNGTKIKRGQFVTSLAKLSEETGLTIQQTRTALKHLEATGEITNVSTQKCRIITVNNYNTYQEVTKPMATQKQTGNKQPNKQLTTIEEYKKSTTYSKRKEEGGCAANCPSGEEFPYDEGNLTDAYYAERGI